MISQEERDTGLLDKILSMDPDRKNWRIRYHLPDTLVGVCKQLSVDVIISKVIPFYQTLVKDTEHEVRSNALIQFEFLSKILYEKSESKETSRPIVDAIMDLLKDQSHHVRNSLINALGLSVKYISDEFVNTELLNILVGMLKDANIEVKLSSIRNLHKFYDSINVALIKEKVVPELKTLCQEKNWKIRFEILNALPHFIRTNQNELLEDFIYFNEQMKEDHIF